MKIIIKGDAGSGKSYFFLPEVIKLLKPKRVFKIRTTAENQGYQADKDSPNWNFIKWEFYNKDVLLNENDLIFVDEPFYLDNEEERKLINKHSNVVMCWQPVFIQHQKWIESLKDYFVIDSNLIDLNDSLNEKNNKLKNLIDKIVLNEESVK
jgi:hypothetical protein